ncbi:ATP-binding protein [Stygiolobus caldivivus]|uniref:ATPase n=1 Tax=Stygiolobus caldivivus TaxID=2824673 RepID=A0A8D5U9U2_9CREN|nr:ATP-binding protein [Stygiolobus caldivivus]BCU71513.1 ATPase [Stygiolobus caldivivus]
MSNSDIIGIVLEGGTPNIVKALIRADYDVKIGEFLIIRDREGKAGLVQVEHFEYGNDFYTESLGIVKSLVDSEVIASILDKSTYLSVSLRVIKDNNARVQMPGNTVMKFPRTKGVNGTDQKKYLELLYEGKLDDPRYVKYGRIINTDIPLLLNVNALPMHMGIFGETGSGKSYNMRYLIDVFSNLEFNGKFYAIPMVVIDANGDYIDLATLSIKREYLNRNSSRGFIRRYTFTDLRNAHRFRLDLNLFTPSDIAYMVITAKYRDAEVGQASLQMNLLELALNELKDEDFNSLFTEENFSTLQEKVSEIVEDRKDELGFTKNTQRALQSALQTFRNKVSQFDLIADGEETFNYDTLEELFFKQGLAIVDFSADGAPGMDILTKQIIVGYIARLMLNYLIKKKMNNEKRVISLVIEEAQNYIPSDNYPVNAHLTKDVLATLATQGRKFGASLVLISQRPAFIDKVVLSMLNSFIFHRVYHEDVRYIQSVTGGISEYLAKELVSLPRGQAIVTGLINPLEIPVRVHIEKKSELESDIGSEGDLLEVLTG